VLLCTASPATSAGRTGRHDATYGHAMLAEPTTAPAAGEADHNLDRHGR
jgi:hypothetical protein